MASPGETDGAGDCSQAERKPPTPKRGGWALKTDQPPQPKLGFQNTAKKSRRQTDVEPADIDTTALMLATRRATSALSDDGMPRDEFITFVAAELGYERTSKQVAKAIDNALRAAAQRGIIYTERGNVFTDCRTIADYPRDLLKKTLLSVVGRAWTTRDEAITAASRHLGFERTGKKIKAAFRSALTGLLRQGDLERDGDHIRRAK